MSYIGNPIVSTDFPKDKFSGNGSTTAFTMSIAPASVNAVLVIVSGITQSPDTYTISGTTLTFSGAPPTGTDNIIVRHLGVAGIPNVPATGSAVTSITAGTGISLSGSTGAVTVTNSSPAVTAGEAKAWVYFDGVSSTSILASYNVSSVTRNGTGDYTVNFTNALTDANYGIVAMAANSNYGQANAASLKYGNGTQNGGTSPSLKSTTQVEFVLGIGNSTTYYDSYGISVAIFR